MKRNLFRTKQIPCADPVIDTEGPFKGIDFTLYETEYSYWDLFIHWLKNIPWRGRNLKWTLRRIFLSALATLGFNQCNNCHKFYRKSKMDSKSHWCLNCCKVVEEHMNEMLK